MAIDLEKLSGICKKRGYEIEILALDLPGKERYVAVLKGAYPPDRAVMKTLEMEIRAACPEIDRITMDIPPRRN